MSSPDRIDSVRRRVRSSVPRRRQVVVRFSEAELRAVRVRAGERQLAVGAWLGELAMSAARGEAPEVPSSWAVALAAVIRERAEIVQALHVASGVGDSVVVDGLRELVGRLDVLSAEVVSRTGGSGR